MAELGIPAPLLAIQLRQLGDDLFRFHAGTLPIRLQVQSVADRGITVESHFFSWLRNVASDPHHVRELTDISVTQIIETRKLGQD